MLHPLDAPGWLPVSTPHDAAVGKAREVARDALIAAVPDQYEALVEVLLEAVTLGIKAGLKAHRERAVEIETSGKVTLVGDW